MYSFRFVFVQSLKLNITGFFIQDDFNKNVWSHVMWIDNFLISSYYI